MNRTYLAGHCLTRGSQLQRFIEKSELSEANPTLQFYNPMENKSINDKKANMHDTGLAERIVRADTDAITWSDTVVIEPLPEACGTMVELGQIKGMRDVSEQILRVLEDPELDDSDMIDLVNQIANSHYTRKVYPHYEDIRRVDGITEEGDRRSLGINQYVYGVCLDLSNGKGFYSWDEILEEARTTVTGVCEDVQ